MWVSSPKVAAAFVFHVFDGFLHLLSFRFLYGGSVWSLFCCPGNMSSCLSSWLERFRSRNPQLCGVVNELLAEAPHIVLLLDLATDVTLAVTLFRTRHFSWGAISVFLMFAQYPIIGWAKSQSTLEMLWRPWQVSIKINYCYYWFDVLLLPKLCVKVKQLDIFQYQVKTDLLGLQVGS